MEKTFAKRYWPTIVGAIVGAIGGYLYWRYVGCSTDTCPITSSPLNTFPTRRSSDLQHKQHIVGNCHGWPIREHFAAKYHKKEQSR